MFDIELVRGILIKKNVVAEWNVCANLRKSEYDEENVCWMSFHFATIEVFFVIS